MTITLKEMTMSNTITPLWTKTHAAAEAERITQARAGALDGHAQAQLMHAAFARRVCAAHLLRTGQPATAEAVAAGVDVDLGLVRAVLDGLVQDREIVRTGALYSWPRSAA